MKNVLLFLVMLLASCQTEQETLKPVVRSITESIYASGVIKSDDQYQVFSRASGIVQEIFVQEGTIIIVGSPILSIVDDAQKLLSENARLTTEFNAIDANRGQLIEARSLVDLRSAQTRSDSVMLERQKRLWAQNIGTKVTLEQLQMVFVSSKNSYVSAKEKLKALERQLKYLSLQAQNNLSISNKATDDYLVKSLIKGKVYQLNVAKGEIVTNQTPIAIIGGDEKYLLEMQIDESDIIAVKVGMQVMVVLTSYRDSVFNAVVSKINPILNLQSKTFTVEAEFIRPPSVLYPNISFEANVLICTKNKAMLIPRSYLLNDSIVVNKAGNRFTVETGLKDYQMVEILSGIDANEELIPPE